MAIIALAEPARRERVSSRLRVAANAKLPALLAVWHLCGAGAVATVSAQAELVGYARLPADTFRDGPPSTNRAACRLRLPQPRWQGQPVQGISSLRAAASPDGRATGEYGTFWALSDNGFGARANSATYLLCLYRLRIHWKTAAGGDGSVEVLETVELRDPRRQAGFRIRRAREERRRLTGADFDPESLGVDHDGSFWIGDEFGPYLLHFSRTGVLLAPPIPAVVRGSRGDLEVRAPERRGLIRANLARSRGFEGLTVLPSGQIRLLLEGNLKGEEPGRLRLFAYTGSGPQAEATTWRYPLEQPGFAIGELTYWAGREGYLVVERDWGHGPRAKFKHVFIWQPDALGGTKQKLADLMDIADPHGLGGQGERFSLPYVTIESVEPMDDSTLVICNDNNYPATGGRKAGLRDDTEFVLLRVAMLGVKP